MAIGRLLVAGLPVSLALCACGDSSPGEGVRDVQEVQDVVNDLDAADTAPSLTPLPGPAPRMGPRASFYDAPVPAPDLFDASSGRPDLSAFPREPGGFVDGLVAVATETDGASLAGHVLFALSEALPDGALEGLTATFIDLSDPDRATHPALLTFEADGGPYGAPNLLAAQPIQGLALLPNRPYALAVHLDPALREVLGRPSALADLLNGSPTVAEPVSNDRALWDEGLAAANTLAPAERLFALTVFRTARATDELLTFVAAARLDPPIATTPTLIETYERFCVYRAELEVPDYQHGPLPYASPGEGTWRTSSGLPELAKRAPSRLFITVPRTTSEGPRPFVVFVRTGGGGDRPLIDRGPRATAGGEPIVPTGTGYAMQFAAAGWAGLTWDGPHGGPGRNPGGQDEQFLMFNVLNLAGTRDSIRQTALEAVLVRELAGRLSVDTSDCEGASDTLTFDLSRSALMGHSMGAWVAPLALAASDRQGAQGFRAAILSGAGSSWMANIVYKKSPVDVRPLAEAILGYTGTGRALTMSDPALLLLQWAGEAADPQSYAHLARPDRDILMIEGIVDTYILPPIAQGTSLGLRLDLAGPPMPYDTDPRLFGYTPLTELMPLAGLSQRDTPVSRNRGLRTAVVVHAPGDAIEDGHEAAFQTPGPKHQIRCFLETLARDGVPTVVTPSLDEWEVCP